MTNFKNKNGKNWFFSFPKRGRKWVIFIYTRAYFVYVIYLKQICTKLTLLNIFSICKVCYFKTSTFKKFFLTTATCSYLKNKTKLKTDHTTIEQLGLALDRRLRWNRSCCHDTEKIYLLSASTVVLGLVRRQ